MMRLFWGVLLVIGLMLAGCGDNQDFETGETLEAIQNPGRLGETPDENNPEEEIIDEDPLRPACLTSLYYDQLQPMISPLNCTKANSTQKNQVNKGNLKKDKFLSQCFSATNNSCWCDQLVRPNPDSFSTFQCTYGQDQVHQLIHPNESTWKHAFEAVKIVEEFEAKNLLTEIIYNWWRPEPYNKNVGGASGRHPFATSVDIRFKTKNMQNKAFTALCKLRAQGRIRAIGYYASTAIHLGIGDSTANTWGKSCP